MKSIVTVAFVTSALAPAPSAPYDPTLLTELRANNHAAAHGRIFGAVHPKWRRKPSSFSQHAPGDGPTRPSTFFRERVGERLCESTTRMCSTATIPGSSSSNTSDSRPWSLPPCDRALADERSRSVLVDVVVDCTAHGRMKSLIAEDVQHFETSELVAHRVFHLGEVQCDIALA